MDKNKSTTTFTLTLNDFGQEILTAENDSTKSYIIDEDGNMTRYFLPTSICAIKLDEESSQNQDEESAKECSDLTLEDSSNFSGMHPMEAECDFESNLMNDLDSEMIKVEAESDANVIMQHMDIREPLSKLKQLLEQRLGVDLPGYTFSLQGAQTLESDKNLVDQCVQGQGTVQINVQLQTNLKRINILDVLKPAEDYVDEAKNDAVDKKTAKNDSKKAKNIVQWQIDSAYRKQQDRLKIPHDPQEWSELHVRHWVQWAVRQFNLPNIKLSDWSMSGKELFQLTLQDFHKIVPSDPGDVFWTHLELLRQLKVVAVKKEDDEGQIQSSKRPKLMKQDKVNRVLPNYPINVHYFDNATNTNTNAIAGARSGNNGQIQLWQFLLELLTSKQYISAISWIGTDGQFKLKDPQLVAQLWGERKNKPHMNYEKLSRALRYYYDGDMISKVHGERFVYKFVCDLKQLLGYSASELANLINHGNPLFSETRPDMFA